MYLCDVLIPFFLCSFTNYLGRIFFPHTDNGKSGDVLGCAGPGEARPDGDGGTVQGHEETQAHYRDVRRLQVQHQVSTLLPVGSSASLPWATTVRVLGQFVSRPSKVVPAVGQRSCGRNRASPNSRPPQLPWTVVPQPDALVALPPRRAQPVVVAPRSRDHF